MPELHWDGLFIALSTFVIIGVFHPIVIHAEYRWGTRCWPLFAVLGTCTLAVALIIESTLVSSILAVLSCTLFWCIKELYEQRKRVERGWFPKNPNRKDS